MHFLTVGVKGEVSHNILVTMDTYNSYTPKVLEQQGQLSLRSKDVDEMTDPNFCFYFLVLLSRYVKQLRIYHVFVSDHLIFR